LPPLRQSSTHLGSIYKIRRRARHRAVVGENVGHRGAVIAGALNVLGVRRVVITGIITELPPAVFSHVSTSIARGILWARFGQVKIEKAPRRRNAGLVAAGIDRLVVPMGDS